jgi:hypothetical protein
MKKLAAVVVLLVAVTVHATSKPEIVDHWWDAIGSLADARAIQTSVEAYRTDYGRYPAAANVTELKGLLSPVYIRDFPEQDSWGTPFLYEVSPDGKSYTIASAGSDRKFDRGSWKRAGFSLQSSDDLVYRDGNFAREWILQQTCK